MFRGGGQQVLELGEDLLDRVEVGRVGREEDELCAGRTDRLADGGAFAAGVVVEDDDVARREGGSEELLDRGQEAHAVDRLVEYARRVDAIVTQGSDEGHRPPVTVRDFGFPRGAGLSARRCRCDQRTALAALTLNIVATLHTLSPASTRVTARSRKSIE
jgi:hypothetical protein